MADLTICKFGCSSIDGCAGHCEEPMGGEPSRRSTKGDSPEGRESVSGNAGIVAAARPTIIRGHALDLIEQLEEAPDLIVTDPPYAFGGTGDEHAISATVATVLRESARRLKKGRWMLVMCAASWRSQAYMVEAVRGVVEPVRVATWCKPTARTKVRTTGWAWASVNVIAFRKGKADDIGGEPSTHARCLDHITAAPITKGRRAELPPEVADWMVRPFAVPGGLCLDPFTGSGRILEAAESHGMRTLGYEKQDGEVKPRGPHEDEQ